MKICKIPIVLLLLTFFFLVKRIQAQEPGYYKITMEEIFDRVIKNSVQLKVSAKYVELAQQAKNVSALYKLPEVNTSINYGYISNADIWTPSFSEHQKGYIPHQFAQFSVMAAQLVFQGGQIQNTIKKAGLEEQIALLNLEKNSNDIKFLVASKYLDICKLYNQRQVYVNNTKLAENQLKNILVMRNQGIVTENDVLRTKINISDLKLGTRKIDNAIRILNKELNMVIGLPDTILIAVDSLAWNQKSLQHNLSNYLEDAFHENHELKIAQKEIELAEKEIQIQKGERLPSFLVFAGSNLQRPFLNTIPAIDIYYNVWQVGAGLRYNISSIYQSPRKIKAADIRYKQQQEQELLERQKLDVAVKSSFIRYEEAEDELRTYGTDRQSAEENYRIVEKKYFNQLALLTDLLDATNTKIEAELRVVNAEINVAYHHYELLKVVGNI